MDLTNNVDDAQVVIIHLQRLRSSLFVDRRSSVAARPMVELFSNNEFLLQGKQVAPPLTSQIVYSIERRQAFPRDRSVVHAYFTQLVGFLATKIPSVRPEFTVPSSLCLAPHFGPVLLLAHSPFWRSFLTDLWQQGWEEAYGEAREKMSELYILELLRPEQLRQVQWERLQADFSKQEEWVTYARSDRPEAP